VELTNYAPVTAQPQGSHTAACGYAGFDGIVNGLEAQTRNRGFPELAKRDTGCTQPILQRIQIINAIAECPRTRLHPHNRFTKTAWRAERSSPEGLVVNRLF